MEVVEVDTVEVEEEVKRKRSTFSKIHFYSQIYKSSL